MLGNQKLSTLGVNQTQKLINYTSTTILLKFILYLLIDHQHDTQTTRVHVQTTPIETFFSEHTQVLWHNILEGWLEILSGLKIKNSGSNF